MSATTRLRAALTVLAAVALLTAGCGPPMADQQAPPQRLVIDVTVEGGQVTPTNKQFDGTVGEPIVLRVNSDVADELHVHSNPEHEFSVEPEQGQRFEFIVSVPGAVDVELHGLNRTIATIRVR